MKAKKKPGSKGLYRDRGKLVIREGARFPDRCAVCNKEADGDPVEFVFGREEKSHYLDVAAAQTVARAASDLVTGSHYTGHVRAAVPMCRWHRNKVRRQIGIGLGLAVLGAAFLGVRYAIGGADEFDPLRISIASVVAIVAVVAGIGVAAAAVSQPQRPGSCPAGTTTGSSGWTGPAATSCGSCRTSRRRTTGRTTAAASPPTS